MRKDSGKEFVEDFLSLVFGDGVLFNQGFGLQQRFQHWHFDAAEKRHELVEHRLPLLTVLQRQNLHIQRLNRNHTNKHTNSLDH